jgi:hypothetical protein
MHTLLPSIVFCVLAQTAAAQCVNPAAATPVSAPAHPTAELISTAAASTRDAPPLRRTSVVTESAKATPGSGDEPRRPTRTAMLLAAVALMSGIALRRASASGQ